MNGPIHVNTVREAVAAYAKACGADEKSNAPIAEATGRKTQHVTNWKTEGRFPPDTFLVLSAKLREKDIVAPPSLWGITEPERLG